MAFAAPPGDEAKFFDWPPIASIASHRLREVSGIAKSLQYDGVYWVHNDSNQPAVLFAINLKGELLAEVPIAGARNVDWEAIAVDDKGRLYIADIGDNFRHRESYEIYELPEPDPYHPPTKAIRPTRVWRFRFPDGPVDSEAAFTWHGSLYLITKDVRKRPVLYRLQLGDDGSVNLIKTATVPLAPITAADTSADGRRLVVCSYGQLAVFEIDGDLSKISDAQPKRVPLPIDLQTEACCFDGADVIVTDEKGRIWRVTAAEIQAEQRKSR